MLISSFVALVQINLGVGLDLAFRHSPVKLHREYLPPPHFVPSDDAKRHPWQRKNRFQIGITRPSPTWMVVRKDRSLGNLGRDAYFMFLSKGNAL